MIIGIQIAISNTVFVLFLDLLATLFIIGDVRASIGNKWHKNERRIAYFHHPLYKKIFLIGLEGVVSRAKLVLTRIARVADLILAPCAVLACCWRVEWTSVLFLAALGVGMALNFARILTLLRARSDFY